MSKEHAETFGRMLDDDEVRELIDAYATGTATESQVDRLTKLIAQSPEVCDYFIAHTALISQLAVYAKASDHGVPDANLLRSPDIVGARQVLSRRKLFAIAASLLMMVAGGYAYWRSLPKHAESVANAIGQIRKIANDTISQDSASSETLFDQQRVDIDVGLCKVHLKNGVSLSIAAPASFVMENSMICRLGNGRLTADVPESANGFRVVTSDADIIDRGTRFGVAVHQGSGTDIAVFDGEVDVASSKQKRKLYMGRGVSVTGDGKLARLQVVRPDTFELPRVSNSNQMPTIVSVRDNIRDEDGPGFYKIVHAGFGEDQPAYVDRVHQWNGVDKQGLPTQLLGGDYIMPYNDDKFADNLGITITLSRTADLFILFDDRIETPDWLKRDYVDTGLDAGQDEGGRYRGKHLTKIDLGAGLSIDTTFSVWKRKSPVLGEVTLEGFRETLSNVRSMYGIVAIPVSN